VPIGAVPSFRTGEGCHLLRHPTPFVPPPSTAPVQRVPVPIRVQAQARAPQAAVAADPSFRMGEDCRFRRLCSMAWRHVQEERRVAVQPAQEEAVGQEQAEAVQQEQEEAVQQAQEEVAVDPSYRTEADSRRSLRPKIPAVTNMPEQSAVAVAAAEEGGTREVPAQVQVQEEAVAAIAVPSLQTEEGCRLHHRRTKVQ